MPRVSLPRGVKEERSLTKQVSDTVLSEKKSCKIWWTKILTKIIERHKIMVMDFWRHQKYIEHEKHIF